MAIRSTPRRIENVPLTDNVFRDCGTGGCSPGQGTGLQYMVAPFSNNEAVGTTVRRNTFRNIHGAAFARGDSDLR